MFSVVAPLFVTVPGVAQLAQILTIDRTLPMVAVYVVTNYNDSLLDAHTPDTSAMRVLAAPYRLLDTCVLSVLAAPYRLLDTCVLTVSRPFLEG